MYKFEVINMTRGIKMNQELRAKVLEVINKHNTNDCFSFKKLENYIKDNNVDEEVSWIVYSAIEKVCEREINQAAINKVVDNFKAHSNSSIIRNWYRELINQILVSLVIDNTKSFKMYTVHSAGRGKHTHYSDYTLELQSILKKLNIEYEIGNDSPRNGKLSSFVQVKIDKRNRFVRELLTEFENAKKRQLNIQ